MKITDTVVQISKDPNQKVFWRDEAKSKSGVSYSGFYTTPDKGEKDGGRFDDVKFNRFINLRLTIFGDLNAEHENLKSGEKIMVKNGKLLIKVEKETNKTWFDLTINEWERYDGRSNRKEEESADSPAAAPAPAAAAGKRENPFKK